MSQIQLGDLSMVGKVVHLTLYGPQTPFTNTPCVLWRGAQYYVSEGNGHTNLDQVTRACSRDGSKPMT